MRRLLIIVAALAFVASGCGDGAVPDTSETPTEAPDVTDPTVAPTSTTTTELFNANEILSAVLASVHNVHFYQRLVREAREAVLAGDYEAWRAAWLAEYAGKGRD